jgi:hypothetical protein
VPGKLSKKVRDVLWQNPFGTVYPPRPNPPPLPEDGRTVALRLLKLYLADLTFYRPGGRDEKSLARLPSIPFKIPERSIHIEWPDDEVELEMPAIALLAQAPADYEAIGLTNYVDEKTRDKFFPGTVVMLMGEYVEEFVLEIWSETKAHRRSMLIGIEQALSPFEQMAGLRFRMPDYYDQLVTFALQTREIVDDEEAVRVRRRARMVIQMSYCMAALVNVEGMIPITETTVDADEDDGTEVSLEDESPDPDPED